MDPTTVIVTISSVSKELNLLNNLLAILPVLMFLAFSAIIMFVLFAMGMLKREKSDTQSQVQPQASNTQQSNTNGIFIEYKTLDFIKTSIALSIVLIISIIIVSLVAPISVTGTLGYQVALVMILLVAVTSILPLYDSYVRIKELLPKRIKKIVKVTTIYEDGTTVEREKKYEY
jgi:UDP-N-acetylmuramyl pentapeptide phosphotransferase/UDP-N-acetylglucosamine-1-phosphate transferase